MKLQIRPSCAHRWIECTRSPYIECRFPDITSPYAAEGIKAHELAAKALNKKTEKVSDPNVQTYLDYIRGKDPENLLVEHRLEILPGISGIADCIFTRKNKTYVVDYKHGAGVEVSITNNPQLLLYAIGVLDIFPESEKFVIVIVQPRNGGIKSETYSRKKIEKYKRFFEKKLKRIHEDPSFKIGEHCKWCKAESHCIARHEQLTLFQNGGIDSAATNDLVETDRFLHVLENADAIEVFIKAVREKAFHLLSNGVKIPNWKLVQKRESAQWNTSEEKIIKHITTTTNQGRKEITRLKTMTELAKIIPQKWLDKFIERKSSGITMAHIDDKRPEINSTNDFNDGVTNEKGQEKEV